MEGQIQHVRLQWSGEDQFKALLIKKNPSPQCFLENGFYVVWFDEILTRYSCALKYEADPQEGSDLKDFLDNWKALCNFAAGWRPYAFACGDFDYAGDGTPTTELTEWTQGVGNDSYADLWFKIPEAGLYLNGGEFFIYTGHVKGDWAEMAVVDKDGVYYPAGTVLKNWIRRRNLRPDGTCECNTPYAGQPPVNVYIRVRLHRADTGNRTVAANFNLHKAI
jgi:hypothetical protein